MPARFHGRYDSWQEASAHAVGYDSNRIFEQTRDATIKVRDGQAVFERDGVILERPEYPLFLIAGLLHAAAAEGGRLNILDFGGALGSSYFQCRRFVSPITGLRWSVVEQPRHVEFGQKELENDVLRFYPTIAECVRAERPNVAILSGVIAYLEKPYELIDQIIDHGIGYVVVDRQMLAPETDEHVCVQTVAPQIYDGSYPCWVLSESRFRRAWDRGYDVLAEATGTRLETHIGSLPFLQLLYRRRNEQ
jgi:putative methyltransferase (TIGR04325 family)